MKKIFSLLTLGVWVLSACQSVRPAAPPGETPIEAAPTSQPAPPANSQNPYAPQDADISLDRADVFLNTVDLLSRETYPPQIVLVISGALPTPCHQLRVSIAPPDAEGRIDIQVYSVYKSGQICTQVLKEFSASVELGAYPSGHYHIYVNGQYLGDFSS